MALFSRRSEDGREGSNIGLAPTEANPPTVAPIVEIDDDRDTSLGVGCRMSGNLRFEGNVRIAGLVEGELHASGTLFVESSGEIRATVEAGTVVVLGRVTADVTAHAKVEIGANGSVEGSVSTPSLVIREGGVFEGRCARPSPAKSAAAAA